MEKEDEFEEKYGKEKEFIIHYFNGNMCKTSKGFIKREFEDGKYLIRKIQIQKKSSNRTPHHKKWR